MNRIRLLISPLLVLLFSALPSKSSAQLPLEEYRERVISYSRTLRQAEAQSDEAYARQRLAQSRLWPQLSASGNFSVALRQNEGIKPWNFSLQPELVATLYGAGLRMEAQAARRSFSASEADLERTEIEIRYLADYAYWNLSAMEAFRQARERYVAIIRSLKRIIEERFKEGYIAKGDVLMVEARLRTAEYELLVAEENFEVALHNFNILQGVESDRPVELSASILDKLPHPTRRSEEELFAARPDLRAATLRIEQAELNTRAIRAGYNPRLAVGISGNWAPHSPNRSGKTSINGLLFARLSVPIFGWGARRRAVATSKAATRQQIWKREELYDDILLEERNGWSAVVESYARIQTMRESLRIAGENLELGTYSYSEGLTTILDVLQTQLDWMQIYTNSITAHFNFAVARAAYERITADK